MGFKLRRENSTIAIDGDYFNLALRQKGSVAVTKKGDLYVPYGDVTVAADQPLIAYRSTFAAALATATRSGGNVTFRFYGMGQGQATGEGTLEWWLFDLPEYGQTYDTRGKLITRRQSDGRVSFDSRKKYLKVMDFFSHANNSDTPRDYPRTPGVVTINRAWATSQRQMVSPPGTLREGLSSAVWTQGNRVWTGSRNTFYSLSPSSPSSPSFNYNGGTPQTMVVDLTNL